MVLVLVGCTQQSRVESLIKDYIRQNANDPSSVEIISISEVVPDSVYSFIEMPEHDKLMEEYNQAKSDFDLCMDFDRLSEAEIHVKDMERLSKLIEKRIDEFKPFMRGYKVTVEYRAKNGFGALMKTTSHVRLNNDMTEIIGFE